MSFKIFEDMHVKRLDNKTDGTIKES